MTLLTVCALYVKYLFISKPIKLFSVLLQLWFCWCNWNQIAYIFFFLDVKYYQCYIAKRRLFMFRFQSLCSWPESLYAECLKCVLFWFGFVLFRIVQGILSYCSFLFAFLDKNTKLCIRTNSWSLFFQSLEPFCFTPSVCNFICENVTMCLVYCWISMQIFSREG